MSEAHHELWTRVDAFVSNLIVDPDEVLAEAHRRADAAGLPSIAVSAAQGKMLALFVRMCRARRVLEIGTLAGYSAIWMARALPPEGRLVTLEVDPKHFEVARGNIALAGLDEKVEIRLGRAMDTLPGLEGPFDLTFIDADKENIPEYFDHAVRLSSPGAAIVVDNVVRRGALLHEASDDVNVRGVRRFHEVLSRDTRVSATTIQTVGVKGYDGFTLAVVNE